MTKSEYDIQYRKETCRRLTIDFNQKTESDILEKLNSIPNKAGYIKELIRKDSAK